MAEIISQPVSQSQNQNALIIVPGHAAFRKEISMPPETLADDEFWALLPFQKGEPKFYCEHIKEGVRLTHSTPGGVLIFSGGRTRADYGNWSEASSSLTVAKSAQWWELGALQHPRVLTEEFATDSYENLLFSLCRFYLQFGFFPLHVHVVGWKFKEERFRSHASALRFPAERFAYHGVNNPVDLNSAIQQESRVTHLFKEHPFGTHPEILSKRASRNPFGMRAPYANFVPPLTPFFSTTGNTADLSSGIFPWEGHADTVPVKPE